MVPQTKAGEVLNSNGTVLLALLPCGMFGYGEFGCSTLTPSVVEDRTADTFVAPAQPTFFKSTTRELHSFALMTVSPLPPDTVLELTLNFGVPFKQVLKLVVLPFVMETPAGAELAQLTLLALTWTV